jgi:FkbM family methyltransferase
MTAASIDLIMDVGANSGQYARMMRRDVRFRGQIESYEPDPILAEQAIKAARHDSRWTVNEVALGAKHGVVALNRMEHSEMNSIHAPNEFSIAHIAASRVRSTVNVEMLTMEAELRRLRDTLRFQHVFVKTDTQGHDLEVLQGYGPEIRAVAGISCEMAVEPLYVGAPRFEAVLSFMAAAGFVLSAITPNNDSQFFRLLEFNGIFVRDDILATLENSH